MTVKKSGTPRVGVTAAMIAVVALLAGCQKQSDPPHPTGGPTLQQHPDTAHPSCSHDVVTSPVPAEYRGKGFDRYYELVVDGKKVMRYLVQPDVTQAQLEHIVRTTRWYVTDSPGSEYGSDKSAVRQKLHDNKALMVIPNGVHQEGKDVGVNGQELYSAEVAAPGSPWYVTNDAEHRDATLEEVFHQVHDRGIGTSEPGALPQYQEQLLQEAKSALADGRWAKGQKDWTDELAAEGSLAQEYIASVIDNYYGLWAHRPQGSGYYAHNNRADVVANDPKGAALLRKFLGTTVDLEAYIDPSFTGTFTMAKSDTAAYSHKSQYLRGARLTGSNPSNVVGNGQDNTLRGNTSDNTLDGGDGTDTVVYCNAQADYTITATGGVVTVTGPDGTDTLKNVEQLHFQDSKIATNKL